MSKTFQQKKLYRLMTKVFFVIRLKLKLILKKITLMDSFCKVCGTDVKDFTLSDTEWDKLTNNYEGVMCYNCFCDKTANIYSLKPINE